MNARLFHLLRLFSTLASIVMIVVFWSCSNAVYMIGIGVLFIYLLAKPFGWYFKKIMFDDSTNTSNDNDYPKSFVLLEVSMFFYYVGQGLISIGVISWLWCFFT